MAVSTKRTTAAPAERKRAVQEAEAVTKKRARPAESSKRGALQDLTNQAPNLSREKQSVVPAATGFLAPLLLTKLLAPKRYRTRASTAGRSSELSFQIYEDPGLKGNHKPTRSKKKQKAAAAASSNEGHPPLKEELPLANDENQDTRNTQEIGICKPVKETKHKNRGHLRTDTNEASTEKRGKKKARPKKEESGGTCGDAESVKEEQQKAPPQEGEPQPQEEPADDEEARRERERLFDEELDFILGDIGCDEDVEDDDEVPDESPVPMPKTPQSRQGQGGKHDKRKKHALEGRLNFLAPLVGYEPYMSSSIQYMKDNEVMDMPSCDYIGRGKLQKDITASMRSMLVDWLVDVAEEYKLTQETLFLSVNIVDRCLSKFAVSRQKLQLLGCAAMLVASKYEEIYSPGVDEFVYISDDTYTREEILCMEGKIVQHIDFRLTVTTAYKWLTRLFRAGESSKREILFTSYLAELTLVDYRFLQFYPSRVAGACFLAARLTLKHSSPWTRPLYDVVGKSAQELELLVLEVVRTHKTSQQEQLKAVREKYSQPHAEEVASITPMELKAVFMWFTGLRESGSDVEHLMAGF